MGKQAAALLPYSELRCHYGVRRSQSRGVQGDDRRGGRAIFTEREVTFQGIWCDILACSVLVVR